MFYRRRKEIALIKQIEGRCADMRISDVRMKKMNLANNHQRHPVNLLTSAIIFYRRCKQIALITQIEGRCADMRISDVRMKK